jgi:hypothetical protein
MLMNKKKILYCTFLQLFQQFISYDISFSFLFKRKSALKNINDTQQTGKCFYLKCLIFFLLIFLNFPVKKTIWCIWVDDLKSIFVSFCVCVQVYVSSTHLFWTCCYFSGINKSSFVNNANISATRIFFL